VGAGREPVTPEQFMAAGAVKRREVDAVDRVERWAVEGTV